MANNPPIDEWPTFAQELGRKVTATLEKWVAKQEQGLISERELYIVTSVMSDTAQGLSPWADMDLVHQVGRDVLAQIAARKAS